MEMPDLRVSILHVGASQLCISHVVEELEEAGATIIGVKGRGVGQYGGKSKDLGEESTWTGAYL
jgi:hypothetical protein